MPKQKLAEFNNDAGRLLARALTEEEASDGIRHLARENFSGSVRVDVSWSDHARQAKVDVEGLQIVVNPVRRTA